MSDFDFSGQPQKRSSNVSGSVLNTVIVALGAVLFMLYGLFKIINPSVGIGDSGLSIAANISGLLGIVVIIVGFVRIRSLNRRKTRGY